MMSSLGVTQFAVHLYSHKLIPHRTYQQILNINPDKLLEIILTRIHNDSNPFRILQEFIHVLQTKQSMDNVRFQLEQNYYSRLPMKLKADWSTGIRNDVMDNRTQQEIVNQLQVYLDITNLKPTHPPTHDDTLQRANYMEGKISVHLQEGTTSTYKPVYVNSQERGKIKLNLDLHRPNLEYTFHFTLTSLSNMKHSIRVNNFNCEGATVKITVPAPLVTEDAFNNNSPLPNYQPGQSSTINTTHTTHCGSMGHTAILMDIEHGEPPAIAQSSNSNNNNENEATVVCTERYLTTREGKGSYANANVASDRYLTVNLAKDVHTVSIQFTLSEELTMRTATECINTDSSDETHHHQDVSGERTTVIVGTVREISVLQMEYTCELTGSKFDETCEQYRLAIVSNDWRQTELLTREIMRDPNRTIVEKAFFRCYHGIELTNAGKREHAIFELKQVLELSREDDSENMQLVRGRAYRIMAGILVRQHQTGEALDYIKKSKEELETARPSCEKACMLVKEAEILLQSSEGTESRQYIESLLKGAYQNTYQCNDSKRRALMMPMVSIERALFHTSDQGKPWCLVRKTKPELLKAKTCLDEYSKCSNIKGRNVYQLKFLTATSDYHRLNGQYREALKFIMEAVTLQCSAKLDAEELCIPEKNFFLMKKTE